MTRSVCHNGLVSKGTPDEGTKKMTSTQTTKQFATNRGTAFLEDIAGTATTSKGVADMLNETCRDAGDWACIFAALGEWDKDNAHVRDAIACITEAAKDFCADWIATHE